MDNSSIVVRGAREHNLRNVNLELPRNRLVVFTGVSGSGKSSLAFDTLYAEGQRRYVESLSSYARQFLGQLPKPDVDYLGGLSPAISIQQKTAGRNPRSTVGTITEIYDYLRVLYAQAHLSLLTGRFHTQLTQLAVGAASPLVDVDEKFDKVVPITELGLGLSWSTDHLQVRLGYELANFFNMVDSLDFVDGQSFGKISRKVSDISYDGLVFSVGVFF